MREVGDKNPEMWCPHLMPLNDSIKAPPVVSFCKTKFKYNPTKKGSAGTKRISTFLADHKSQLCHPREYFLYVESENAASTTRVSVKSFSSMHFKSLTLRHQMFWSWPEQNKTKQKRKKKPCWSYSCYKVRRVAQYNTFLYNLKNM